jgi:hypothetical protein
MGILAEFLVEKQQQITAAQRFIEPKLDEEGLTIAKLENKDAEGLRKSLEKINHFIVHAGDLFPNTSDDIVGSAGLVRSVLLGRKAYILERLKAVGDEENIHTLRDLITNKITNPAIKDEIEKELDALERNSRQLTIESKDLLEKQTSLSLERDRILMQDASLDRRAKVWLSFLEKESASTLIGAVILVLITICLIASLLIGGKDTLQVLSNGFLVILGYFFGQASRRPVTNDRPPGG